MASTFDQWSTIGALGSSKAISSVPDNHIDRINAYQKYEEMYWNDPTQYRVRVLAGESPIYVPNAQIVVNTTSHYLLKGLNIKGSTPDTPLDKALVTLFAREKFYTRFNTLKLGVITKGDGVIHLRANPNKPQGSRISLNLVVPDLVFPEFDQDNPDKLLRCDLVAPYTYDDNPNEEFVSKLTYTLVEINGIKRVFREEGIFRSSPAWYSKEAEEVENLIPYSPLDPLITTIPIYWVKNKEWLGWLFGSSELKSLETLQAGVTQQITDIQGSLSLDGLGVYATDGGRPIDAAGNEVDWQVYPGTVLELAPGSTFKRVQGISTIVPAMDQVKYLEQKILETTSITDVARGRIDTTIAESGVALAISFLPTLAKIEPRDTAFKDLLSQLFNDWKIWHQVYEKEVLEGEVVIEVGDKLPLNRGEKVNELNNMFDRRVISGEYYREEMKKLGYTFPEDIQDTIVNELQQIQEITNPSPLISKNESDIINKTSGSQSSNSSTLPKINASNNKDRVNESNGTESELG